MPNTAPIPLDVLDGTLTVDEIAVDLQRPRSSILTMCQRGELPAFKVGRDWRVGRRAYADWKADRAAAAARRLRYVQGL